MKYLALLALLLTGCMTPDLHSYKPRPEVFIEGFRGDQVKAATVNLMINRGWLPISTDPLMLTFEKELPFGAQIFVREIGAQPAKHQFMFTILEQSNSVRVVGSLKFISTRWGKVQNEEAHMDAHIQYQLESIRAYMLSLPMPTNQFLSPWTGQVYTGKSPFGVTQMKTGTN